MKDIILLLILTAIIGAAVIYIRKHSKKGVKCVGCPFASGCGYTNTKRAIEMHKKGPSV